MLELDHLIESVIGFADGDAAWTANCGLVSKAWTVPARRVALRSLTLRDPLPARSLIALFERQPSLAGAVRTVIYSQVRRGDQRADLIEQNFAEHPRTDDGSIERNVFVGEHERAAFVASLSGLRSLRLVVSRVPADFDRLAVWDALLRHCPLWTSLSLESFHMHQGDDPLIAEAFARLLDRVGSRLRSLAVTSFNALDGPAWLETPLSAEAIDLCYWSGSAPASIVSFLASLRQPPTRLGLDIVSTFEMQRSS